MIPLTLLTAGTAYVYGAVYDYKHRQIPNLVPVLVLTASILGVVFISPENILYVPISNRALAGLLIGIAALIVPTKDCLGGGDFKLMITTGFLFGMIGLGIILIAMLIYAKAHISLIKKEKFVKIPMAAYMLPAVATYLVILWLIPNYLQ